MIYVKVGLYLRRKRNNYFTIIAMDIQRIKDRLQKEKDERYNSILEYWKKRKVFTCVDDIPDVPIVKAEDYKNVIVPNIIRCGGIPKKDLIVGQVYVGSCRNAEEALWDGKVFIYKRRKFAMVYDEEINHFEDDDGYDVFVPIKLKKEGN